MFFLMFRGCRRKVPENYILLTKQWRSFTMYFLTFSFRSSIQKWDCSLILGIIVALIFRWILAQFSEQLFVHIRYQNDYFLINSVSPIFNLTLKANHIRFSVKYTIYQTEVQPAFLKFYFVLVPTVLEIFYYLMSS